MRSPRSENPNDRIETCDRRVPLEIARRCSGHCKLLRTRSHDLSRPISPVRLGLERGNQQQARRLGFFDDATRGMIHCVQQRKSLLDNRASSDQKMDGAAIAQCYVYSRPDFAHVIESDGSGHRPRVSVGRELLREYLQQSLVFNRLAHGISGPDQPNAL
jgi:hypothetical protein